MREPHPELMYMAPDKRTGYELWRYLENKWPQLNSKTHIAYTSSRTVRIAMAVPHKIDFTYPYPRKGAKALFWRVTGDIFRKPKWAERGITRGPNPLAPIPYHAREIELEWFGWQDSFPAYLRTYAGITEPFYICAGYDGMSDTLYINKG